MAAAARFVLIFGYHHEPRTQTRRHEKLYLGDGGWIGFKRRTKTGKVAVGFQGTWLKVGWSRIYLRDFACDVGSHINKHNLVFQRSGEFSWVSHELEDDITRQIFLECKVVYFDFIAGLPRASQAQLQLAVPEEPTLLAICDDIGEEEYDEDGFVLVWNGCRVGNLEWAGHVSKLKQAWLPRNSHRLGVEGVTVRKILQYFSTMTGAKQMSLLSFSPKFNLT